MSPCFSASSPARGTTRIIAQHLLRKSCCAACLVSVRPVSATLAAMPQVSADLRALRAMSHPLRLRILDALSEAAAPMRSTDLAQRLGEPGNVVRYHVATLRKSGLLNEVDGPEGADGREHWYRAASDRDGRVEVDDSDAAAAAAFTHAMTAVYVRHAEASREAEVAGLGPRVHADGMVWLMAEDAQRIARQVAVLRQDIMESWRKSQETSAREGGAAYCYGLLMDFYPDAVKGEPVSARGEAVPSPVGGGVAGR